MGASERGRPAAAKQPGVLGFARPLLRRAFALALLVLPAACLEPISDSVPLPDGLLDKSIFTPEKTWIVQQTLVSASSSAPLQIGAANFPETIRFEIQENYLILKRANPLVVSDDAEFAGIDDQDQPVAVYPILGHFDVVNGQVIQPQKSNWYQRQYFTVDFSKSLTRDVLFLENVNSDPVSYWVTNSNTEESPIFSGDYIEVFVHRFFPASAGLNPASLEPQACSSIPDFLDCASIDVGIRISMLRMDNRPAVDAPAFEDADWPKSVPTVALFATNVINMDPQYLGTLGERRRRPFIYNIWKKSFDGDGVLIPYRSRETNIIPFHVSAEMPDSVRDAAETAVLAWDPAFVDTVHALRTWECVDAGGDEAACSAEVVVPEHILILCPHTPVVAGDDPACGPVGTVARSGDLRYNLIDWVTNQVAGQPSAVAWWTGDLVTAETVHGDIKIAGGSFSRGASEYRDQVLTLQGRGNLTANVDDLLHAQARRQQANGAASPAQEAATAVADGAPDHEVGRDALFAPLVNGPLEVSTIDREDRVVRDTGDGQLSRAAPELGQSPMRQPYLAIDDGTGLPPIRNGRVAFEMEIPAGLDIATLARELDGQSPDEIFREILKRWAGFVIAHELGHVFGMRHNFAASYDALNFGAAYWETRRSDCGPRWSCAYLQSEVDGNLQGSALSSVMDYPTGPNNAPAIGHFDRATIAEVYGKLTTAFADPSIAADVDAGPLLRALWSAGLNPLAPIAVRDASAPEGYRYRGFHYSQYPSVVGDLSARVLVPGRRFLASPDGLTDDRGRIAVPFRACNEDGVGLFAECAAYDVGADPYEIVKNAIDWYDLNIPLATFRRGRLNWSPVRVAAGMHQRAFAPLRAWNAFYAQIALEYADLDPALFDDPGAFESLVQASAASFNFMGRVLATPVAGAHFFSDAYDGTTSLIPAAQRFFAPPPAADADADIPLPLGRPYASEYSFETGSVDNIGSFIDKQFAIETLFEPLSVEFAGRITWDPADLFMVSFANTHHAALIRLVGAVVANDWEGLAPTLVSDNLVFPDYNAMAAAPAGTRVSPALGFNLRLRVLAWSLALMNNRTTDRSFFDHFRIFDAGSTEDVPGALPRVDFYDVASDRTLSAVSFVEEGEEGGIGARVLARLSALDALRVDTTASAETLAQRERDFQQQRAVALLIRDVVPNLEAAIAVPR